MTCHVSPLTDCCDQHPDADTYVCQVCGRIECATNHAQRDGVNVCTRCRGRDTSLIEIPGKDPIKRRMTDAEVVRELPELKNDFANSLYTSYRKFGWSDKQLYWAHKLVYDAQDKNKPVEPDALALAVQALFDYVREGGMKRPMIKYKALVLDVYGPMSKRAGQIRVHILRDDEKVWCGSIDQGKAFIRDREALNLLKEFNQDPVNLAAIHGRLSGECCFCRRELSTKESVGAGYGPICADKWGLPWGAETAAHYDEMKGELQ